MIYSIKNIIFSKKNIKYVSNVFFLEKLEKKKIFCKIYNKKHKIKKIEKPIIIAIDAGHGGQDPGAIGYLGSYEKNITLSISKKLRNILKKNKIFKPFLIRNKDCFISIKKRLYIIKKNHSNVLISIHVDSSINRSINYASIWISSTKHINSEFLNIDKKIKKKIKEKNLSIFEKEKKFNKEYSLSEEESNIAIQIIKELRKILSCIHKPKKAELGILKSFKIPSLLIEVGFLSNKKEEKLLSNEIYQEKIANAIYSGINLYYKNKIIKIY